MNKLLQIIIAFVLIIIGIALSLFAVSLLPQISDWIMIALDIFFFCTGMLILFSGIRIARGDSIKRILGELLRAIGR